MKDEEWKKVIDINLTSTFLLSKYAIKKMLKNKFGRVVNITSIVGHTGNIGQANYSASKAGIIGMSKSLAIEYAKKNITVNCVSPGFIVSDMTMNIAEKVKVVFNLKNSYGKAWYWRRRIKLCCLFIFGIGFLRHRRNNTC